MNDKLSRPLLLEQLEERIFLDANPLAAVAPDSMVEHAEPVEIAAVEQPVERETTPAAPPVTTAEKEPDGEQTEKPGAETTASTTVPIENSQNGATAETAAGSQPVVATSSTETSTSDVALAPADLTTSSDATSSGAEPGAGFGSTEAESTSLATSAAATEASDASEYTEATVSTADLDISLTTNSAAESQEPVAPTAIDLAATSADASLTTTTATVESATAIDPMIGENFTFTVTFDNPGTIDLNNDGVIDTVYGPYIDLVLDRGLEGTEPTNGSWDDGISFQGAAYLGQNVQFNSQIVSSTGSITHYWATDATGAPLVITGLNPGDEFVTLLLPFGSFTPGQTPADIVVTAHMSANADVDTALNVEVITGALYGTTPLNDPGVDAPLRGSADGLSQTSLAFMPEVIAFNTDILLPGVASDCQQQHDPLYDDTRSTEVNHQEIPTGPNFPGQYVSTIDIAAGQTVGSTTGGIIYTQHIPDSVYYLGNSSITVEDSSGNPLSFTVLSNPAGASGGDLVIQLNNPTVGTSGNDDVVIRYGFYIPEQTGSSTDIINPTTGDDAHIINDGEVTYRWTPIDSSHDTTVTATIDAEVDEDGNFSDNADVDDISHAKTITIQKDHTLTDLGATGYTPGDVLSYTLDFQVSDYFSFGDGSNNGTADFTIVDTIGNGLVGLDGSDNPILAFTANPVITIYEEGVAVGTLTLNASNQGTLWWATDGTDQGGNPDGSIDVHYDLQAILLTMGDDGILNGGYTSGSAHGATYGTITYQTTIQQYYANGYQFLPGAEHNVDQGDTIEGGATITGDVYDRDTSSFTGANEADGSCDDLAIVTGGVSKAIYAINGETNPALWDTDASGRPRISPGDTVSYRLTYDMPISSTENFHLIDYLPLPVFNAADPDLNGTPGGWNMVVNPNLDGDPGNNNSNFDTDPTNLQAGDWFFTSQYTYEGPFDSGVVDQDNNALDLRWNEYHDTNDDSGLIDLVFTVKVSDAPFADGLFLTNQVTATEQGTLLSNSTTNDIVQIVLDEPVLAITKDAAPVAGIDAGDTVSFSIEVENTGHAGAFDLRINDTLPADYNTTATNFTVTRDGVTLALGTDYTWITGGGVDGAAGTAGDNFFADPGADGTFGTADDGYAGGIELIDRDRDGDGDFDGALAAGETLTITYDLVAATSIEPLQTLVNTATITNYAGANGGPDHTLTDLSDNATVTAATPTVSKVISDTGESSTSGNNVVIGETVTYTVTITVPEGTSIPDFTDTLDAGLALVGINSISASPGLSTSVAGGFGAVQSGAVVGAGGSSFSLDFGTLTNSNINNGTAETITINYTAVVLNTPGNQQNTQLDNTAEWRWIENGTLHSETDSADYVTIQEPQLQVIKDVSNNGSTWVNNGNFDQGDSISYRITVQHSSTSREDAFDAVFTDTLPDGINWTGISIASSGTATLSQPVSYDALERKFTATWDQVLSGQYTTFIISGGVLDSTTAGQSIGNTGTVTWESLNSDLATPISTYNPNSVERTGSTSDPGGLANDYSANDPAIITVAGTIDKLQPIPNQYAIGDVVTYDIVVTLPEGTTNNLVVTDALPTGMVYVGYNVVSTNPNNLVTLTPTVNATASDIAFSFGTVEIDDDNITTNNSFTLQVTTRVDNITSNQQGTSLLDHASMTYTGGTASDGTDPTVFVIEPQISSDKQVANLSNGTSMADSIAHVEAGDTLQYTVVLSNTGSSTAYEVEATDTLAPGTSFVALTGVSTTAGGGVETTPGNITVSNNGATVSFGHATWDIPVGQSLTLTYTVLVSSSAVIDGAHVNTVDADWTSQNGTTAEERVYADQTTAGGLPLYGVDGAQDQNPATFTIDPVTIAKTNNSTATTTIGDTVTYTLTVTSPDGTIQNLQVSDAIPSGVVFAPGSVTITQGGTDITANVTQNVSGGTVQWIFNPTTSTGPADPTETVITGDALIVITYTGTVANIPANENGDTLTNTAALSYTRVNGTTATANTTSDVPVHEPQITTLKSVVDSADAGTDAQPGESLTYTARFTNTGTSIAYETSALDTLAPGTGFGSLVGVTYHNTTANSNSSILGLSLATDNGNGTVSFGSTDTNSWDIGVGDWIEVQYTVTVLSAGFTAGSYTNTVDADWSSQNGTTANERVYDDTQPYAVDGTQDTAQATFTVTTPGSIGDRIWFDSTPDGVQAVDASEPGISNVWVHLTADANSDGTLELDRWVQTSATGNYLFDDLPVFGNYTVTVDYDGSYAATHGGLDLEAAGYSQTYDFDGTAAGSENTTRTIAITTAQPDILTVDFGYTGTQSVGDLVWYDADGDGVQPNLDTNEGGLGGITVEIQADIDGDGTNDYRETTTTANDGSYHFDHLPAGSYTVSITLPTGAVATYDRDDLTSSPDGSADFVLPATGGSRDDIDFGIRGNAQLGDRVFFDVNNSGTQDGADLGIANVTVNLSVDLDGDFLPDYTASAITDSDGIYHFNNLLAGNYTITVDQSTLPQGMHQTFDPGGSASLDSTHLQTLAAGGNITTIDFGYTGNGAIGDRVWWDGNSNGFQDAGEPGLSNVQIQLVCDFDGDGTPEIIGTTTTDQNGNYLFSNLPAAAGYVVSVVSGLPSGADPTYDLDNISSPNITTTNLSYNAVTGQVDQNLLVDFGYRGTGTLGDRVWNDLDSGGDQDAGEPGLAGVTVTLTADLDGLAGNGDEFVLSTVTDANGNYNFDGLFTTAGGIDYTITVNTASLPASFSQTYDYDGLASPNTAQATLSDSTPQNLDVDFGYNVSSALGDRVWLDSDGDGVQDAGEHGLAGMTVTLYDHNGVQLAQQTTGSNGQYLFNNLAAGAYTVSVSNLPQGLQQTFDRDGLATANTAAVTIGNQASDLTVDFGYRGTGSIGDRIWNDLDNGSDQDAGEPGLAGVTVTLVGDLNHDGDLLDPEDTLVTTTDASGIYHFDGLFAGNYTVTVTTAPPGMVLTADPQGAMDGSASVTLGGTAPMVTDTVDFGYHQTGTIGDRIWYDLDADGVQDAGELGLNNVTVSLYQDTDNDGVADGSAIATAFTTADGQYLFTNLNAGSYVVIVDPATLPGGMTQTYDPQGALDHQAAVALPANGAVLNIDFGYTGTGSIGDTLWNDLDGGGDQDTGEPGLAGVRVILTGDFNNDGTPDQLTTITDANGTYHFNHLVAGNYTVSVDTSTLPIGMTLTADPQGPADNSALVTLGGGQPMVNNAIDFGYRQSGTIGDTIWYDLDADGTQDAGELGLANIHVILTGDYDGDGDIDTLHQFTDAQGHYFFTGLQAGTYDVIVDTSSLPGGMVQSGDPDAILNNRANVTLATAQSVNLDQDFGYTGTGSIGDTVWYDFDGDGIQDPNEAGIPGVTITLTGDFDNDGQVDDTITAITGPNGQYLFDHLPQGQYLVTVNPADLPGGMVPTGDPDGTPDNQTSLTLAAGQNSLVQDFGYTGTGAIGDTLWNDRNRNGIQDPGEAGLAGVTVSIGVDLNGDGNPDFTATTTTDADGRYIFDHLPAGSHTVRVDGATLPRGIRPSYDPDGTLDGSFVVQLGAGEQNLDVDFGYAYPPPVVAKPQPQPFVPPVTPPSEPDGLVIDAFFMHRQFGELERFPFDHFMEISYPQPPLPVSPIYTGMAEPGTTLELSIYDGSGNLVGSQTIMADTGGNWLASFPGSLLHELPHDMLIEQKMALYNESTAGLFNMRTYFNPNFTSLVKTSTILDVDTIFDYLPSTIMDSMHSSLYGGFNIRWNSFNGYEFFATSINPAETGR